LDEDAPDIIKTLREEERQGLLCSKSNKDSNTQDLNQKNLTEETDEKKQIVNLNKTESKILNVTSHELRTPIAAIKGYVQIILKEKLGTLTEEQKKSLEIVLRNANRLDSLIQDLLDISRLDSGRMRFVPEKTNIEKMIQETIETVQQTANKKQINLYASIEKPIPEIVIDSERVKQVITNLLNNSIKFSEEKSKIYVYVKTKNEYVLFEVKDYGRGISQDKKEKIFDAFYQVNLEDKKLGGVGLGLAISRGIIIAHGGKMWVESRGIPGEGSTFSFILPIKAVQNVENRFDELDILSRNN
jgi:signal transduction histidine kinase